MSIRSQSWTTILDPTIHNNLMSYLLQKGVKLECKCKMTISDFLFLFKVPWARWSLTLGLCRQFNSTQGFYVPYISYSNPLLPSTNIRRMNNSCFVWLWKYLLTTHGSQQKHLRNKNNFCFGFCGEVCFCVLYIFFQSWMSPQNISGWVVAIDYC